MISLILSVFLNVNNKQPNPRTIAIQLINVLKSITTNCYNPALDKPKAEDINHTTRVNQPKEMVLKDTDSQGLTKTLPNVTYIPKTDYFGPDIIE